MKKINVGCGQDVRPKSEGWTNLDIHKRLGADCIFDLNDIFKGKKLPFQDETFDYVLCSHVLEDFIDPVPIMDELVRITKVGGYIDLKVPYETTTWDGVFHKKPFNTITFQSYMNRADYANPKLPLKIVKLKLYFAGSNFLGFLINPVFTIKRFFFVTLGNFLMFFKSWIVDYSIMKYFLQNVALQCVYRKTGKFNA